MADKPQENCSGGVHLSADYDADRGPDEIANGSTHHERSIRSSSDERSSIPLPFDLHQDVEDNVNDAQTRNLMKRIQKALLPHKSYKEGYEKGQVDQIIRSLNEYKQGYGKVAGIANLDLDFLIYRKFGWLHNYALLHLQDELAELQAELESLDLWEERDGDIHRLVSHRLDYGRPKAPRRDLMGKIHKKLAEYDESLLRMQQIQSLKRPTKRSQRNVYNLIMNTQSLVLEESEWIHQLPDLVALGYGGDHGWLNTFLEDSLNWVSRKFTKAVFSTPEQRIKTGDEAVQLVCPERLDIPIRAVLTITAAGLLLVPVLILFELQPSTPSEAKSKSRYQLLTIFLFTLLFSALCSIFTKARRQEVFTATAAYCAVLVVFLGNASNVMVSG